MAMISRKGCHVVRIHREQKERERTTKAMGIGWDKTGKYSWCQERERRGIPSAIYLVFIIFFIDNYFFTIEKIYILEYSH